MSWVSRSFGSKKRRREEEEEEEEEKEEEEEERKRIKNHAHCTCHTGHNHSR